MTREEARDSYLQGYGRPSICNNIEVDAIIEEFCDEIDEEDLIVEAMFNRLGTPSPRVKCTFKQLPTSAADVRQAEFDTLREVPDVRDVPKLRRYIILRYKLHADNDMWLVNVFVERFQKLGN